MGPTNFRGDAGEFARSHIGRQPDWFCELRFHDSTDVGLKIVSQRSRVSRQIWRSSPLTKSNVVQQTHFCHHEPTCKNWANSLVGLLVSLLANERRLILLLDRI